MSKTMRMGCLVVVGCLCSLGGLRAEQLTVSPSSGRTESLLALLATRAPLEGQPVSVWYEAKDRALTQLALRNPPVPGLTQRLIAIADAAGADAVTRDYIVQHLQLNLAPRVSPSERAEIRRHLRTLVKQADSPIAGSALLAMQRFARTDQEVTAKELDQVAMSLLSSKSAPGLVKATALNVLAEVDPNKAGQIARDIARDESSPMLRSAAHSVQVRAGIKPDSGCVECTSKESSP